MPDARKYMFMPVKRRFLRPNALLMPNFFFNIKPSWLEGGVKIEFGYPLR